MKRGIIFLLIGVVLLSVSFSAEGFIGTEIENSEVIKKVDINGAWEYIVVSERGTKSILNYRQLETKLATYDKRIASLIEGKKRIISLMENCVKIK